MGVKLTKKLVDGVAPPVDKDQLFLRDTEIPGFGLRVTRAGAKSWIVEYRIRGKGKGRITIGRCNKVPLDKARIEARKIVAAADLGRDPAQERKDEREDKSESNPLFGDFADRWLAEVAERRNRAGTLKHRRLLLQNHIKPRLGRMRLADITRRDIEELHHAVSENAPVAANRAVSLCSAICTTAVRWGLLTSNPASDLERNSEHGRERYLTPDELGRLQVALDGSPAQDSADVVRLLILTGARVGEVLSMRCDQMDLEAGVWTKPAATTKQNRLHRVPLSPAAVAVLRKRVDQVKGEWVFPGDGSGGHMTTIRTFWAAVCRRSGMKGVRIHDLRHTFASLLVSDGESLPVVGALLGHTQAKTTSRYAHLSDDPLRKAADRVAELIGLSSD